MFFYRFTYIYVLFALLFVTVSCQNSDEYKKESGVVWNTTYNIVYESKTELTDSILNALRSVDSSVSAFNDSSVVSRINRNEISEVDSHFKRLYEMSCEINKASGGAFDPTISPLVNAWGFGYESQGEGKEVDVDSLMQFVGLKSTQLQGDSLIKTDRRTTFNFSAIAKGYGCDEIGKMFDMNGVEHYMVEIGGEIALSGVNPRGGLWRISIDRPILDNENVIHESQMIIAVSNCGVATSGNYRNYKELNGKRIAHTIDPKTGNPIQTDVVSATIIASTCAEADAYATASMVVGSEAAKQMILANKLKGLLIMADGNVWKSKEFELLITE